MTDHPQPCGCVIVTDESPVIINGADMSRLCENVAGVRRCADHQAAWDAGIRRMADRIDREFIEKVYGELSRQASAQGDGAGV